MVSVTDAVLAPDGSWWGLRYDGSLLHVDPGGAQDLIDLPGPVPTLTWIVVGPDDALWIFSVNTATYYRVSLDGTVTAHQDPVTARIGGVLAHPDGTFWILTSAHIVRMAPDGTIAGAIPLSRPSQGDMALAPDGTVFVVHHDDTLSRVAPDGDVTPVELDGIDRAMQVVVLPDGRLFVMDMDDPFGEVADDGTVELIDLADVRVRELVVGPEGDLWVAGFDAVARITADREVIRWDLPESRLLSLAAAPGPDGRLWVTDLHQIHRVTSDGTDDPLALGVANASTGTSGVDGGGVDRRRHGGTRGSARSSGRRGSGCRPACLGVRHEDRARRRSVGRRR